MLHTSIHPPQDSLPLPKACNLHREGNGIACDYHTILPIQDQESGHITGKKTNPAENFNIKTSDVAGKNIILIDDVITRGMTYVHTTNKLINNGANMVKGLFLAKTINPDWVRHSA